jgi:hypothetical protein
VIGVASPIFAQEGKTEIPPAITIPDMLLTHLGTLKFAEAFPKRLLSDAQRHSIAFPEKNLVEPTGFGPNKFAMTLRNKNCLSRTGTQVTPGCCELKFSSCAIV